MGWACSLRRITGKKNFDSDSDWIAMANVSNHFSKSDRSFFSNGTAPTFDLRATGRFYWLLFFQFNDEVFVFPETRCWGMKSALGSAIGGRLMVLLSSMAQRRNPSQLRFGASSEALFLEGSMARGQMALSMEGAGRAGIESWPHSQPGCCSRCVAGPSFSSP